MDFMHDTLADGRSIRVFMLVDVSSRACVVLRAAPGLKGSDVVDMLQSAGYASGGLPQIIQCDHGTEFTLVALDHWAYRN